MTDSAITLPSATDTLRHPELFPSANGFQKVLMRPFNVTLPRYKKRQEYKKRREYKYIVSTPESEEHIDQIIEHLKFDWKKWMGLIITFLLICVNVASIILNARLLWISINRDILDLDRDDRIRTYIHLIAQYIFFVFWAPEFTASTARDIVRGAEFLELAFRGLLISGALLGSFVVPSTARLSWRWGGNLSFVRLVLYFNLSHILQSVGFLRHIPIFRNTCVFIGCIILLVPFHAVLGFLAFIGKLATIPPSALTLKLVDWKLDEWLIVKVYQRHGSIRTVMVGLMTADDMHAAVKAAVKSMMEDEEKGAEGLPIMDDHDYSPV
ncbi:hypothetical protein HK104_001172 [Borealophlyctis nickersoniae]|nr:hypothetical protein HK104_001172 [Borealophlyctis nickersoniae]